MPGESLSTKKAVNLVSFIISLEITLVTAKTTKISADFPLTTKFFVPFRI